MNTSKSTMDLTSASTSLASSDGLMRQQTRAALVANGERSVSMLVQLLTDARAQVRWEAAKALSQIASTRSIPALIEALRDEECDVRWLAAEALVAIGQPSLRSLLHRLAHVSRHSIFFQSAHHVIHHLDTGAASRLLDPVLRAMDGSDPGIETPLAVYQALMTLDASQAGDERPSRHARQPEPHAEATHCKPLKDETPCTSD